jgi:hypothetical protein
MLMYLYILLYLHNKFGGHQKNYIFHTKKDAFDEMSQGIMGKWTQLERHLDRRGKCGASAILSAIR